MTSPWQSFADELARWRDAGRVADFWWRDYDATRPAAALTRTWWSNLAACWAGFKIRMDFPQAAPAE